MQAFDLRYRGVMSDDNKGSMDNPTLFTCARSRGFRGTWAAAEANTPINLQMLPFPPRYEAPDFLNRNPLGTVPLLEHDGTQMTESCAIAVYLAGLGKDEGLLVRKEEPDYASFLDFAFHADATITFPQTVYMRFAIFEKQRGLEEAGEAYAKWFYNRLVKLEQRLETREFLCADRFTVADICCGYALILAKSVGLDEGIPQSLKAYRSRLCEREGYKAAVEMEKQAPLSRG